MTTPHLISTETIQGVIYEMLWGYFVTSNGGCGTRRMYRIDGKKVTRAVWEAAKAA